MDEYFNRELIELDKMRFPISHIRRTSKLARAPANIFGMAFGLFMLAAPLMDWIGFESPTLGACFAFAGICEYIIGIFNWYEGRTVQSFVDFVFGFLHLTIFYTVELGKYSIEIPRLNSYMQGTFYCLWFVMILMVILAAKDRGFMYLLNGLLLALGTLFIIIWEFSGRKWQRQLAGYFIFFASILLWLTGFFRVINAAFRDRIIPCIDPAL